MEKASLIWLCDNYWEVGSQLLALEMQMIVFCTEFCWTVSKFTYSKHLCIQFFFSNYYTVVQNCIYLVLSLNSSSWIRNAVSPCGRPETWRAGLGPSSPCHHYLHLLLFLILFLSPPLLKESSSALQLTVLFLVLCATYCLKTQMLFASGSKK